MKRMNYIDNIKILLAFLVILFHTSSAYGGAGGWYFVEPSNDELSLDILTFINVICQSFFMGFFFFISAYFIPKSFMKKKKGKFLADRLLRLVFPALLYCFILNPICVNLFGHKSYIDSIGFYNLWFPMALFYFTLCYVIIKEVTGFKLPKINFPDNKMKIFIFIAFTAGFNFVVRLIFKVDHMYFSDFTLGFFPQYIVLFILGIVAYENEWLDHIEDSITSYFFRISIISILVLPVLFAIQMYVYGEIESFYGGFNLSSLLYCLWEPFVFVGIILKIIHTFKNKFNYSNKGLAMAARCSYLIYIIQSPIIILLVKIFRVVDINIIVKTSLVTSFTFFISLFISNLILKIKILRRIF